jgi:hypothetical protein
MCCLAPFKKKRRIKLESNTQRRKLGFSFHLQQGLYGTRNTKSDKRSMLLQVMRALLRILQVQRLQFCTQRPSGNTVAKPSRPASVHRQPRRAHAQEATESRPVPIVWIAQGLIVGIATAHKESWDESSNCSD